MGFLKNLTEKYKFKQVSSCCHLIHQSSEFKSAQARRDSGSNSFNSFIGVLYSLQAKCASDATMPPVSNKLGDVCHCSALQKRKLRLKRLKSSSSVRGERVENRVQILIHQSSFIADSFLKKEKEEGEKNEKNNQLIRCYVHYFFNTS